ncbi:MAG: signal peptide peptidase SppA [Parashewanella sp.]
MSTKKPLTTKNTLKLIWNVINFIRQLVINIVFFPLLLIALIGIIVAMSTSDEIKVENGSALLLNISGQVVDQKRPVDPIEAAINESRGHSVASEVLLSDIIYVINNAAQDKRIKSIVLDTSGLTHAGVSKLESIGQALTNFKKQGKTIIANANFYNQQQYLLASYADKIYLNPQGAVMLEGLSRYTQFFKSALDKLKIKTHIFRVGTFKSAVEPFMRDDMSPAAKEANQQLLSDIWGSYEHIVAHNRQVKTDQLVLSPEKALIELEKVNGDAAQMALNLNFVDALLTPEQFRIAMIKEFGIGSSKHNYNSINFNDYLSLVKPKHKVVLGDAIGVIVAKGTILNGSQPAGDIGGKSTSDLLRDARFDNQIKAVVLRVDSPGGSAFASEQIRQELLALKQAGKPVVVSMGTYAASGGYWISASADYIYATPTTLTGSIGIFGLLTTFEDSLAELGVHSDGVSTSKWAGFSPVRGIAPELKAVIQRQVERGYHEFISLVAKERNMTLEQVDKIAQGRVWSGQAALKLGLVDELGDMDDAITKAAQLAKLTDYDTQVIEKKLSAEELLMQELFASVVSYLPHSSVKTSVLETLLSQWSNTIEQIQQFDDPQNLYLFCEQCR